MKWFKEHKIIVGLIIVMLILATVFMLWKKRQWDFLALIKKRMDEDNNYTGDDAQAALLAVAKAYGKEVAARIEQVARLETGNFTSRQYQLTGTGGMESHGAAPYYGWGSNFWLENPSYAPIGTTDMLEGKGLSDEGGTAQISNPKVFVILPSVEAWMMFLAYYAETYKAQGGINRWYSTDSALQAKYAASYSAITPQFVNAQA